MTLVLRYSARSDRGLVRSNNEDSVYAGPRLVALADGMGGHAAGEVASQLVINSLAPLDDDEPRGDLLESLNAALEEGNAAIANQVELTPERAGMGTTLTAMLFAGSRVALCHIGDSRGYLLRDGELTRITRDDTFVQTLVDQGRITAEQAHTHPQRSLIMRAVTGGEIEPTLNMREVVVGDRYLLCSDGLSDVVTETTISETLDSIPNPDDCARRLIELALRGGGPDNVSVAVVDVADAEYGQSRPIYGGAASIDDDDYIPDPATAAGRAAALRSPREPAAEVATDDAPEPKHPHRKYWLIGIAAALVIAVVAAIFIARAVINSNYYIGVQSHTVDGRAADTVVVYQGLDGSVLGWSMRSEYKKVCLDDPASDRPAVLVRNASDSCVPLRLSDLNENARASLAGSRQPKSRAEAESDAIHLNSQVLPLCDTTAPAGRQCRTPS